LNVIGSPQQMISHTPTQPHVSSTVTINPHSSHMYRSPSEVTALERDFAAEDFFAAAGFFVDAGFFAATFLVATAFAFDPDFPATAFFTFTAIFSSSQNIPK
jgi:hypothetical protein